MDHDDYETLPVTSVAKNMMAGATAGVLEHCIMYPMDSVKTRMQSLSPITAGQTIVSTYRNMVLKEGWRRPIRGMGAVVAGAGPAHALYFATYEYSKDVTLKMFPHHQQLTFVGSAVTATLIHDAISNPTEVIKQRLQMYNSPYKSIVQCARGVYQSEGVRAFYRSYTTQLIMNLPYQTIHFTTYEFIQNLLNHDHKYNPPVHMVAGALAGGAASAFTTPLDVVKTLLNTQETGIGLTKGMREAVNQIYTMAGPRGFFKGLYARVLYAMPATAICWSTYEFAKFILSQQSREDYHSSPSSTTTTSIATKPTGGASTTQTGPVVAAHLSPKDVLASAADKVRLDDTIRLGYVLPTTRASGRDADDAADEAAERKSAAGSNSNNSSQSTSNSHSSSNNNNNSNGSLLPRELPSMSGAGVYSSALSLNTMHTTDATARPGLGFTEARGCST